MKIHDWVEHTTCMYPESLKNLPEDYWTERVVETALQNGFSLKYVPLGWRSYGYCLRFIDNDASDYQYVPEEFRTVELTLKALRKDGRLYREIPDRFQWNKKFQMEAVKSYPFAIKWMEYKRPSKDVYREAIRHDSAAIMYVKEPTLGMMLLAVRDNWAAIRHLSNPPEEVCLEAVRGNPEALKFISYENQTFTVIREALSYDSELAKPYIMNFSPEVKKLLKTLDKRF